MTEERKHKAGWLTLVASPIGNLEDMTYRAVRVLSEADVIAAEDTRRSRKLCEHYTIQTPLISYHAYNEHRKTRSILNRVQQGENIAVLSDAGMPVVSDPGFLLARHAAEEGVPFDVIPGVSALTYAVAAAGLPADRFLFAGFPPSKPGKRQNFLEGLKEAKATVFLFESPYRIQRLVEDIRTIFGDNTYVCIIREATKVHEERVRGTAGDTLNSVQNMKQRGEFVVGIDVRQKL